MACNIYKNQAYTNKRAVKVYSKYYIIKTFKERDYISIAVPPYNKGFTDLKQIFGKILSINKEKLDLYEIVTPYSILNKLYSVKKLLPLPNSISLEILTKQMKKITLAYAVC